MRVSPSSAAYPPLTVCPALRLCLPAASRVLVFAGKVVEPNNVGREQSGLFPVGRSAVLFSRG